MPAATEYAFPRGSVSCFPGKVDVRFYRPLRSLLPYCRRIPKGHILVVLKSFFDGGNEADSTQYDFVSLASVSGTSTQWNAFERDWGGALKKHGVPWLHTTDVLTFNEPYTKASGWNGTKRDSFLSDCVSIIESHIMQPNRHPRILLKEGLIPLVTTINLKDYIRARSENSAVPKNATMLLATQSVSRIVRQGELFGATSYDLMFDRNEPYMGHVSDRMHSKRAQKNIKPITEKIASVGEGDAHQIYGLQMADLFAWCYSHSQIKYPRFKWKNRLLNLRWWVDDRYEYDALKSVIQGVPEIVEAWRLPNRKPTR